MRTRTSLSTKAKKAAQAKAGGGWNRHVGKFMRRYANKFMRREASRDDRRDSE